MNGESCSTKGTRAGRRTYLSSEERKKTILATALTEFSTRGYSETSMERIASCVGLSKAGIYAHYRSKDEIFKELLHRAFDPPAQAIETSLQQSDLSLEAFVDLYLDHAYQLLDDPEKFATFQLIITEMRRMPERIKRWLLDNAEIRNARNQAFIDRTIACGIMRTGPLTEQFGLAVAPLVLGGLLQMGLKNDSPISREQLQPFHRAMLIDMLRPACLAPI